MRGVWAVVAGAGVLGGVLVGSAPMGGASAPPAATITVFAGTGTAGSSGNGGPAGQAELNNPSDEAVSLSGTVYIADFKNCQVRQVAPDGTISAFAGTGTCATTPLLNSGGQAAATQIGQPSGVAVDASGNVYIANCTTYISGCFQGNVAKVAPNGILTNFAGNGTVGSTGDGGPATSAEVGTPWAVRTDRAGNVYFTDTTFSVVRKVNTAGTITTVAGTGTAGYGGDGGPATQAQLSGPTGLYVDASGNLFIADKDNFVIRKVAPDGVISTIAGNHIQGTTGDGGPATSAELNAPWGVVEDNVGVVYIADYQAGCVREVFLNGVIATYAGVCNNPGTGNVGNGGPASSALLDGPSQLAFDPTGNLYINEYAGNQVRTVTATAPTGLGYWLVASDGGVFNFGDAGFFGSTGGNHLNSPVVGMARTPDWGGYWLVASDGGIFNYGDAGFFGSAGGIHLNKPIVGMAETPDAKGYWLVATDGGIFTYGDAGFFGSAGGIHLNQPIVGMAATPDSKGYWLVANDGGIFSYGDAAFFGSTGSIKLNKPIVGMAATPDGKGYWLVATDGGIFSYGDATFYGSTGGTHLNSPVWGMAATPDGKGYWLVATDGGIFNYGDAAFYGSTGAIRLNHPVVGIAPGL